jgi:hypothetical protein
MGNLQTEFDFFIKNQQAVDEKESPGPSHLLLLTEPHPCDPPLPTPSLRRKRSIKLGFPFLFFLQLREKPFCGGEEAA